ncbi:hypothetical protein RN001_016230 [Aquatica leii]|uniref:SKICH domain-containing protein n=1 Tax=Aquatica leii TaxID=1421715 RepID=A0AAN7P1G5_9COLE|nr:hypothetical protein RN001_016230 [Aquatica leii]
MNLVGFNSTLSSMSSRIEFIDVQDQYTYSEDLTCKYNIIDYDIQEGDRIAIFKLGWQYIKDYVLFEWVPQNVDHNFVVFNKHYLPKNTTDIYQFCFISAENDVQGASELFHFVEKPRNLSNLSLYSISDINEDRETLILKEENEFLRNTLKVISGEQKANDYNNDIENLKKVTSELRVTLTNQQNQIKDLHLTVSNWCIDYKALQKEKENLENICENLKKCFQKHLNYMCIDFGEFESMPPFPFAKYPVLE